MTIKNVQLLLDTVEELSDWLGESVKRLTSAEFENVFQQAGWHPSTLRQTLSHLIDSLKAKHGGTGNERTSDGETEGTVDGESTQRNHPL